MLLPLSAAVAISMAIILAMRSTKEYPKNWSQLRSEFIYQWLGFVGIADDISSRKRNRIGKWHAIRELWAASDVREVELKFGGFHSFEPRLLRGLGENSNANGEAERR